MDRFFSFLSRNKSVFSFKNRARTGQTDNFSSPDGDVCLVVLFSDAERNFYLDPNFVQDTITFNDYINTYAHPSISGKPTYTEPEFTFDSFYKFGDPIYIIYPTEARGEMVLPTSLTSNQCVDQNSMGMFSFQMYTFRKILNIGTEMSEQTVLYLLRHLFPNI